MCGRRPLPGPSPVFDAELDAQILSNSGRDSGAGCSRGSDQGLARPESLYGAAVDSRGEVEAPRPRGDWLQEVALRRAADPPREPGHPTRAEDGSLPEVWLLTEWPHHHSGLTMSYWFLSAAWRRARWGSIAPYSGGRSGNAESLTSRRTFSHTRASTRVSARTSGEGSFSAASSCTRAPTRSPASMALTDRRIRLADGRSIHTIDTPRSSFLVRHPGTTHRMRIQARPCLADGHGLDP